MLTFQPLDFTWAYLNIARRPTTVYNLNIDYQISLRAVVSIKYVGHCHKQLGTWDESSTNAWVYDTIRDAIVTCARKPTCVSLIYRTEPTTEEWKTERLKSKKQICSDSEATVDSLGNPCSQT